MTRVKRDRVFIVAGGIAREADSFYSQPHYRKATRNMILANESVRHALEGIEASSPLEDCGYVLGTCHGELETTIRFLSTLSLTGVARPMLFQNSLHNSTTGFVCMDWKISGPMMTVSRLHFTGEDALDAGRILIERGQCGTCLVTAVDAKVPELIDGLQDTQLRGRYVGEGAATVLLASQRFLDRFGGKPLAELLDIQTLPAKGASSIGRVCGYESDAIEELIGRLQKNEHRIELAKPDGSRSVILCQ